ncbi:hypothetical protein [Gracilibacillus alcaliphilus]|uniref:hypothetical protein n=1 Tax=Gracilibacillus alcaliphilus TaxID=1401441 RepID=UPI001958A89C|nr:hypothetical protein [Gracilibacillus alcaliphilus]MBM7678310.1 hypothetical protein [Gracilibacillus alcaliphilus]
MSKIVGWISFLLAVGLFCLQMGYLVFHQNYHVEYVDYRLFYWINIICTLFLLIAILLLTRIRKMISCGIAGSVLLTMGILLMISDKPVNHIISLSPDGEQLLLLKENTDQQTATYYRTYYGILARPQQDRLNGTTGEFKVQWVANDIAVITYPTTSGSLQQFVATYGDRGSGYSYYHVEAEIYGTWQGPDIELIRDSEGLRIIENGEMEEFDAAHIRQFGTLAIVLEKDGEAVWTISLDETFQVDTDPSALKEGTISIYKATMEENEPVRLHHQNVQ